MFNVVRLRSLQMLAMPLIDKIADNIAFSYASMHAVPDQNLILTLLVALIYLANIFGFISSFISTFTSAFGGTGTSSTYLRPRFLAGLSSSRSLVVCLSVCLCDNSDNSETYFFKPFFVEKKYNIPT